MSDMTRFMETNHETCFAVPARARALTALVVPIFVVGYTIVSLGTKGYTPLDYPYLVTSGQLDVPTLIIGLSSLTIWVLRYCPPAYRALRATCLICGLEDGIRLSSGVTFTIQDVDSVDMEHGLVTKSIKFSLKNGSSISESVILATERMNGIHAAISAYIKERRS
jgi:hypothetical protein